MGVMHLHRCARRTVLLSLAATAIALVLPPPAAADTVLERKSVLELTSDEVDRFRRAVDELMRRDPVADPTSWIYQANVHDVPQCTGDATPPGCVEDPNRSTWPEQGRVWAACPHGNLLFLSWHRWYLVHLERLLRDAAEDESFTLPYWNYSQEEADLRRIPAVLLPAAVPNPLYARNRNEVRCEIRDYWTGIVNLGDPLDPLAVDASDALDERRWKDFSREVERLPHNQVHVALGGLHDAVGCSRLCQCEQSQPGLMISPATAARDPVFWLHHANIDRLWSRWLDHPDHENPTAAEIDDLLGDRGTRAFLAAKCASAGIVDWTQCKDAPIFVFVDVGGTEVKRSARELIRDSLTTEALGYRYDDEPEPVPPGTGFRSLAAAAAPEGGAAAMPGEGGPRALGDRVEVLSVGLDPEDRERAEEMVRAAASLDDDVELTEVLLRIEGIRLTGDAPPIGFYEIYLNLPADDRVDVDDANLRKAYADHYVGVLNFFALGSSHAHPMDFEANVTENVFALRLRGRWQADDLALTFVPRGPHPAEPAITFERVDLVYE